MSLTQVSESRSHTLKIIKFVNIASEREGVRLHCSKQSHSQGVRQVSLKAKVESVTQPMEAKDISLEQQQQNGLDMKQTAADETRCLYLDRVRKAKVKGPVSMHAGFQPSYSSLYLASSHPGNVINLSWPTSSFTLTSLGLCKYY